MRYLFAILIITACTPFPELESAISDTARNAPFPELTPVAQEEFLADDGESYVVAIPVTFRLQ